MNRRSFLRGALGLGAAAALPSQVWPFRKIFIPNWRHWIGFDWAFKGSETGFTWIVHPEQAKALDELAIEAVQLEQFAHELPDLFFKSTPFWSLLQRPGSVLVENIEMPLREARERWPYLEIPKQKSFES